MELDYKGNKYYYYPEDYNNYSNLFLRRPADIDGKNWVRANVFNKSSEPDVENYATLLRSCLAINEGTTLLGVIRHLPFTKKGYFVHIYRTYAGIYIYNGEELIFISERRKDAYQKDLIVLTDKASINYHFFNWYVESYLPFRYDYFVYLNMVLPLFCDIVAKESGESVDIAVDSITIGAEAYANKADWKKHGIHFNRGILLYLLSYTLVPEVDRSERSSWVIKNYQKYLPAFQVVENAMYIHLS